MLRAREKGLERQEHDDRDHAIGQMKRRHGQGSELEDGEAARADGQDIRRKDDRKDVLAQQQEAKRRNHQSSGAGAPRAQRRIDAELDEAAEEGRERDRGGHGEIEVQSRDRDEKIKAIGGKSEDRAVRQMEHVRCVEHDGKAHRHQGIDRAVREAIQDQLRQFAHRRRPSRERLRCRLRASSGKRDTAPA